MINKKRELSGKTIMKEIFIILLLLIIVVIVMQLFLKEKQDKRNEESIQNYPNVINAYLQDKYGKSFDVNPNYEVSSGSPIPGKAYTPYIYEVWEYDAEGYAFNVCIYPVSINDYKIKDIIDNYYWKFLNIETKKWFKNELAGILPQDYKFILHSMYSFGYFDYDENIKPNLPLKAYFETKSSPVSLSLNIVIPPSDITQNTECTEDNIKKVINDFYINNPNSEIEFYLFQAKTIESYENINERALENIRFSVDKDWINVWDLKDIEIVMEIEVVQ